MSWNAYLRGCARKKRFRTESEAMVKGRKYGQRAYECSCCGFWHLTSKKESA